MLGGIIVKLRKINSNQWEKNLPKVGTAVIGVGVAPVAFLRTGATILSTFLKR
jgi:hypothetical protein